MRLLLIRHGNAEDRDAFAKTGRADDERPLTANGLLEMRAAARGLRAAEPGLAVIATSPLARAVQTAGAVAEAYPDARRETIDALVPEASFTAFASWLRAHAAHDLVAAVGHNPQLSELARWLTDDDDAPDMKKGSALLLAFDVEIGKGKASLVWYRKPRELIALAG